VSKRNDQQIEVNLEAAFDRYNRAVIMGMEPTSVLFIEALEAEGLRLSLAASEAPESREPAQDGSIPVGRPRGHLVPRRARALF
jgi:hypothetical protein